jgi:hypothetical protein
MIARHDGDAGLGRDRGHSAAKSCFVLHVGAEDDEVGLGERDELHRIGCGAHVVDNDVRVASFENAGAAAQAAARRDQQDHDEHAAPATFRG